MNTGNTSKTFGNGIESTRDALNQAGERIEEATRGARKAASEGLSEAASFSREQAGEAYDAARSAAKATGRYVRENPMQAVMIGLGGLLLASLLFKRR